MSTLTFNEQTSCAFCRANKKSWNHPLKNSDDQVVCVELLNYKCPYCKQNGHTTKHCPVIAQKEEQRRAIKQVTNLQQPAHNLQQPPNSWAAKAAAKIPKAQQDKIDEDNLRLKKLAEQKQTEKALKDKLAAQEAKAAAKANWERWYLTAMPAEFGLKEAYGPYPVGSFWEFFIEGKQFQGKSADTDIAKALRQNHENKTNFHQYLAIKYYRWLDETEGTEDDCAYLWRLREEEIRQEEDAYFDDLDRQRKEQQRFIDEEREIQRKLHSGELTQEQYRQIQCEQDEELDHDLHADSLRYDAYLFNEASRRRQWQLRKDAIETV